MDTCQREGCQDYSTDMCVGVQKSTGAFMDIGSSDRIYSSTKWCPVLSRERCQSGSIEIHTESQVDSPVLAIQCIGMSAALPLSLLIC